MILDFSIDIKTFDQDAEQGWRAFLPPPGHPSGPPTPAQFKQAGDAISQYYEHNKNRGNFSNEEVKVWEFSIDFHAFQMYMQSDDEQKEAKSKFFLEQAISKFDKVKNNIYLMNEYGPTVKPYLEATLIFLNKELEKEEKQKLLQEKISEMLKIAISDHPEKNVAFFSGRVHDMAQNPTASYTDIFRMPPKFPPLPGTSEWVLIHSIEEHRAYVQVEKKSRLNANQEHQKTSPLIMKYQTYIEQDKIERQRLRQMEQSPKPNKYKVSVTKPKKS